MSWTLVIEHVDESTTTLELVDPDEFGEEATPSLTSLSTERKIVRDPDEPDRAEATVYRDSWAEVVEDIDPIDDRFFIEDPDGVRQFASRLRDHEMLGVSAVSVLLDGPKRDAIDAEASAGNEVYDPQPDDDIVLNELLPRVPTVGPGVIERQTETIAFEESHASPGKSITKLAEATGAETLYTVDFELDYVESLGDDRTDETLEPGSESVIGQPRKREKTVENVTHVTVLGAQEGTAQIQATAVVDETTEREVHRQRTDKDIQRQERAQEVADRLKEEYEDAPEWVEVEMSLAPAIGPALGDSFHVVLDKFGIDDDLRVVELRHVLDSRGERFESILSNRRLTRELRGDLQRQAVDEFWTGNAGQYFFNSDARGWEPIDDGEPFEFDIPYPDDVVGEYMAELTLKSTAYRRRVVSLGHDHPFDATHGHNTGGHDHPIDDITGENTEHGAVEQAGWSIQEVPEGIGWNTWFTVDNLDPHEAFYFAGFMDNTTLSEFFIRVEDDDGNFYPHPTGAFWTFPDTAALFTVIVPTDSDSYEIQTRMGIDESHSISGRLAWFTWGQHEHPMDTTTESRAAVVQTEIISETTESAADLGSGIATQTDEHVEDVTVTLNGDPVIEDAGDGDSKVDETVSIAGLLAGGDNPVVVTTESLGEVIVEWRFEGIKNAQS